MSAMKVRVSRRVVLFLEGSQAGAERDDQDSTEHPDDLSLMRKVHAAPSRKDGSCTVELTEDEMSALRLRGDWLQDSAAAGFGGPEDLADINAGRGLMRQIDRLRQHLRDHPPGALDDGWCGNSWHGRDGEGVCPACHRDWRRARR